MESYLIYIALVLAVIIVLIFVIKRKNTVKETPIDIDELVSLFNMNYILSVEFIRNKIVVNFKDITFFNIDALHGTYAKGITVVGDKIKFYVSDDPKINEKVYNSIKQFIER